MTQCSWIDFRDRFPDLAEQMIALGAPLYEAGVEEARKMKELQSLKGILERAPFEAREMLGFRACSEEEVLVTVFNFGASLLLLLEKGGKC